MPLKSYSHTLVFMKLQNKIISILFLTVAHGEGEQKAELDHETHGYLQQNVKDIKQAQVLDFIFTKSLCLSELQMLTPQTTTLA